MASGRSQLGADIHEIDNSVSRCGRLLDKVAGDADAVEAQRDEIVVALNATAIPYFGDVAAMTYAAWLERYVELAGTPPWPDISWSMRFVEMLQRAEARLHNSDRGQIPTLFADVNSVNDPQTALTAFAAAHPTANDVVLHPADVPFFVELCGTPGKPVNFVPVLDADVRLWWRSDSLWQAQDRRYGADEVCIVPGPVSVAGIDRIDEPIAELLQRFEDVSVDGLLAIGDAPLNVSGRRRVDAVVGALGVLLAAPDVLWAGRLIRNPIHRLGTDWVIVDDHRAELAETGAFATVEGRTAVLSVPLSRPLMVTIDIAEAVATEAAPIVTTDAAEDAMTRLLFSAAGSELPAVVDGIATITSPWHPDLVADHAGVTADGAADRPQHPVPDVLVGLV